MHVTDTTLWKEAPVHVRMRALSIEKTQHLPKKDASFQSP